MEFLLCTNGPAHGALVGKCTHYSLREFEYSILLLYFVSHFFPQRSEFISSIFLPSKIHIILDNRLAVALSFQEASVNH